MNGFVMVTSTCCCCGNAFMYNPNYVPSVPFKTGKEPVCRTCMNLANKERARIGSAYSRYERSWTIKYLFPTFVAPAGRIREKYSQFNLSEEILRLDQVINRFTAIIQDSALWPRLNPSDTTVIESNEHQELASDLDGFHRGDSTAVLFKRSDRCLRFWELFINFIRNRGDSTVYNAIAEQVQFDSRTLASELSKAEASLGEALTNNLKVRAEKQVQQQVALRTAANLDDVLDRINGNEDPAYRLGDAVTELRRVRGQLDPVADAESINAIRSYLRTAERFSERQKYTYKVEAVPANGHLHVEVTGNGQDPTWSEQSQIIEGFNYSARWKLGDDIHIALDTVGAPENWGKTASDKKILKGRYALFEMNGEVSFDNLGRKVSIRFTPVLSEALPELK